MNIRQYVNTFPRIVDAAKFLGIPRGTLLCYMYGHRTPRPDKQKQITRRSRGLVTDFNIEKVSA
jgi:hypothetical protein